MMLKKLLIEFKIKIKLLLITKQKNIQETQVKDLNKFKDLIIMYMKWMIIFGIVIIN